MKKRLWLSSLVALGAAIAAIAASATPAAAVVSGNLKIVGPWAGADAQSFRAVLAGFAAANPGVNVTYATAQGDVAASLATASADTAPDLAVLSLPYDSAAMKEMALSGRVQPIDFLASTIEANYAFSWKQLGSANGHLVGVFFKATDRSALWYDQQLFRDLGLTAPTSWGQLQHAIATIKGAGLAPFALSGASGLTLPDLFANLYLTFQGAARYDKLVAGSIPWSDSSVTGTLTVLQRLLTGTVAGGAASVQSTYAAAVQQVFGSPAKAYMVPGGSAVLPVLYSAKAVRPLAQFGAFAMPAISARAPARVIGDADAVVMSRDSAAARALLAYLATPDAATIWAKRGGDFLSPNRHVDPTSYTVPQLAMLAEPLAAANVFRFPIGEETTAMFAKTLNQQLAQIVEHTASPAEVAGRLAAASSASS